MRSPWRCNRASWQARGWMSIRTNRRCPLPCSALENVVLLPHLGSATAETREAMGMRALANVEAFASGEDLPDRVT